jgi:hypothetical protein
MLNEIPTRAPYQPHMARGLLALDKCLGIRPIGRGKTWRQAIAKYSLPVTGSEAKEAYGIDQLCTGLESGIEGGINTMQFMWEQYKQEEDWNAFNEQNRTVMLWMIGHERPLGPALYSIATNTGVHTCEPR